MISIDVKLRGEEIIARLDRLPNDIDELVAQRLTVLTDEIRLKALANVEALFGKKYASMFSSGVQKISNQMLIGFVEFTPSDEWYLIRVGAVGALANRADGFFSKADVMHPPMKEESVRRPFDEAWEEMGARAVEELEDAIFEAVYR